MVGKATLDVVLNRALSRPLLAPEFLSPDEMIRHFGILLRIARVLLDRSDNLLTESLKLGVA
jgi:hypothetical protein